jgi:two-component system, OmpR family, response regulator QseB
MKSLLLVDDEVPIALELQRTLQGFGFHVEAAHTFESALDRAGKSCFDAILVEFNLRSELCDHPRTGNGPRLISELRALKITVPILMLTVMKGTIYEAASFQAGADDFILKPIPIPNLVSRLRLYSKSHETKSDKAFLPDQSTE